MGTAGRIAAGLAVAIVLLLVAAQLLLPGIAASRISSRVGRYGAVQSVKVSAWPAIKLLWGDADSVRVRATRLRLSPSQTAALLWEGRGASRTDITVPLVQEGPLRLQQVALHKRGDALSAQALIGAADVQAALPPGISLALLASEGGGVRVRASGGLFGIGAWVQALAEASEGKLVAHPLAPLLSGVRLTLFADPHVHVQAVGASAVTLASGEAGYRLTMRARLG